MMLMETTMIKLLFSKPRHFLGILNQIDESLLQWLIQDIDLPQDDGEEIAQAILMGQGKCTSRGNISLHILTER